MIRSSLIQSLGDIPRPLVHKDQHDKVAMVVVIYWPAANAARQTMWIIEFCTIHRTLQDDLEYNTAACDQVCILLGAREKRDF